jgi:hypothetical protein
MQNRVFFPQSALDQWIVDGTVELEQGELVILGEARRYHVVEAVRVVREVTGTGDPHELVGRVKTREHLEQLGAEIVEGSMVLGDQAYDVEPGWVGVPIGMFAEHVGSEARRKARGDAKPSDPKTDEELLAKLLARAL